MIKQVYEQVLELIEADARQLSPGERLPSEMQYARQLAVSRLTVRKAVDELARQGLVKRIAGKGLEVGDEAEAQTKGRLLISMVCMAGDSDMFRTMMGCVEAANQRRYEYKLLNVTDPKDQYGVVAQEELRQYDGAVLSCFGSEAELRALRRVEAAGVPVVTVCNEVEGTACALGDDYNGGYLAGEYLVQRGHTRILYLRTDRHAVSELRRLEGFRQALRDNGLEQPEELVLEVPDPGTPIFTGLSHQRPLPQGVERYLRGEIPHTAVTGYSTLPILSYCYRLHEQGLVVPDDISVVAYGDQPYLPWQDLPLTAVMEPKREMGLAAVELLDEFLSGGRGERPESRILPVRFVTQKSVRSLGPADQPNPRRGEQLRE